ncbi:MAG: tRNA (adenosine(37)-N6)-threonylcarbamoyltransferase complex ATPase subunit type 1 TsaE [Clostridia bacterium]|nr:tRNA (adenosine(37)-N6)-threonylcarbamoyltransferase complex ATPase subunit type 1 TsaE [Clostridia bacterium]
MLIRRFECADPAETARLAAKIREGIEIPFLMTLQGDLGAGKTELVRDILEGYGITSVKSPTFTIVREYEPGFKVYHIDAYRLGSGDELLAVGFDDFLSEDALIFVEWADLVEDVLPKERLSVTIQGNGEEPRVITLCSEGDRYDRVLEQL